MDDNQNTEVVAGESSSDNPDNSKKQPDTQKSDTKEIQYPYVDISPELFNYFSQLMPFRYPLPFPVYLRNGMNQPIYAHNWQYQSNPSDVVINSIKRGINNDIICKNVHNQKYISDTLNETLTKWSGYYSQAFAPPFEANPIFINAPTGYGKTTFVLDTLKNIAYNQGYYVLLIVNRSMLRGQIARIASQISLNYTLGTEDNPLSIYENIIICTYQHFLKDYGSIMQELTRLPIINKATNPIAHIGYIVMDEVHYFISDSTFSGKTQEVLRNIIRFSYLRFDTTLCAAFRGQILPQFDTPPTMRRIYMTATPDYVRDIIRYEERCAREVRSFLLDSLKYRTKPNGEQIVSDVQFSNMKAMIGKQITEYDFPKIKRNYKPCFYFSRTILINKIISSPKNEKWLVFVSSKDDGKSICDELKNKNIKAEFIYTENTKSDARETLEVMGRFDCQVLVSTSVLDNGVSIKEDALKNIAVDSVDSVQFLQMIGRKRLADGESVNLYIKNKNEEDINSYLRANEEIIKNINESYSDIQAFEDNINSDNFVGRDYFKYNMSLGRHCPSDYAKYLLDRKHDELVRLRSNLSRDENAFAKLACEWLGLQFDDSMIENDSPYLDYWSGVEDLIKKELQMSNVCGDLSSSENDASLKELVKCANSKPFVSKGRLQNLLNDITEKIKKIKQGSGIRTEKDEPMKSINSVLDFFAGEGFDHYAFAGKYDSKEPNKLAYYLEHKEKQDNY